ncbi:hypothetical protein Lser_V15G31460 [Lactuca serriola]
MSARVTVDIDDPPPPSLSRSTRPIKSANLPDFAYSTYSGPFASFIANIHHLCEPESYREVVLDRLCGDDHGGIESLKHDLAHRFAVKDLVLLYYLLGIETVDTPVETNARYYPTDGGPFSDLNVYRTIVGSLVYIIVTLPDIAHVVHVVSQFVMAPTSVHWGAILRILRYFRGTQFQTLLFPSTSTLELCVYSDADWDGDRHVRKYTTRFCVFLGESLISQKNKKQDVFSRSSIETEYHAMAMTTCEIIWLRWLLADMEVHISSLTPLHYDSKSVIQIAKNLVFHERTKTH